MRKNIIKFDFVTIFLKRFLIMLLCGLIFASSAFVLLETFIKEKYRSEVQFYVSSAVDTQTINDNYYSLNYTLKIIKTFIKMLDCNEFYQYVSEQSNGDYSPDELREMISFEEVDETGVFSAYVTSFYPEKSYLAATVVSKCVVEFLGKIEKNAFVVAVDNPKMPSAPIGNGTKRNVAIAFAVGFLGSYLFFVLRYLFDVKVYKDDDFDEEYNIAVVGNIPKYDAKNVNMAVWEEHSNG